MPSPGFRRSLPLLDLSPAESTQIRIDPEQELPTYELALAAAQAGSLGGSIGGPPLRAIRGGSELWSDPLAADRGRLGAAFASDNPYVAATYAGPKGKVYPFRISPDELVEARHGGWVEGMVRPTDSVWQDTVPLWKPAPEGPVSALGYGNVELPPETFPRDPRDFPRRPAGRMTGGAGLPNMMNAEDWGRHNWPHGFSTAARELPQGRAQVARNVMDTGPSTRMAHQWDRAGLWQAPSEQWAYGPGTAVESAGSALTAGDLAALQARGLDSESFARAVPQWAAREGLATTGQAEGLLSSWDKDLLIDQIRDDPRFTPGEGRLLFRGLDPSKTSLADKAGAFLRAGGVKKMLKSAFSPASLLTDATIGAGVGAASALAGYAAGQPRSAGVFNLPGEYQQALSQEDLLAQIEAKNVRKEALRQKYIDEVNALHGPGTLQPGARIEEISNYLGPVRGLQGR